MMRTLTPIFSIIIGFAVFFFYTQPILDTIAQVKEETGEYQKANESASRLNEILTQLLNTKNSYKIEDQERLQAFVPAEIDGVRLLVDLKEMAKTHNMLLGNISVENDKNAIAQTPDASSGTLSISKDSFMTTDVSFSLIGTYGQFRGMLHDLEMSLVLMEITNIGFSASEGQLQQFDITVRAYALPNIN